MGFSELARYLETLERLSARNEMTRVLSEVLKTAPRREVDKICYLLLGELVPSYRGIEFNIAEKLMVEILAEAYGRPREEVGRLYKAKGDLGDVAYGLWRESRSRRPRGGMSVGVVYDRMLEIAGEAGAGSQERKIRAFAGLLGELDPRSAKYVARIPLGKLRLGFSEATLLDALSLMAVGDKSARHRIEAAFNVTADIGAIAKRVKTSGLLSLARLSAKPGIPIRPSLAERLPDIGEVFEKAGPEVGVEQKLDGFRTQIHVWADRGRRRVALFSRNLENTTAMFPEIVESAKELRASALILDGETIGYNPKTGTFAPFQETVQRKRKHEVAEFAKKIPLKIFVFDVLFSGGRSLLGLPFRERRKILAGVLARQKKDSAIMLAPQKITGNLQVIRSEFAKSLEAGLEGLVLKKLEAPYQAGSRGFHWIKLKATSAALAGLRAGPLGRASPGLAGRAGQEAGRSRVPDTIDCIVMGAYRGRGKRTKFGVGGFLLGVRGADDRYYTISRLGTGLSDEQFREAHRRMGKLQVKELPREYVVEKDAAPDIWVKPSLVVEILADEITLSPRHTAGRPDTSGRASPRRAGAGRAAKGRGYSLRFPRLVRFRGDKDPEDATTVTEIANMYRTQKS